MFNIQLQSICIPENVNLRFLQIVIQTITYSTFQSTTYLVFCCRLSDICNHVKTLLFKAISAYKLQLFNLACASKQNKWKSRSGAKQELNTLREIKFTNTDHSKGKGERDINFIPNVTVRKIFQFLACYRCDDDVQNIAIFL